MHSHISSFLNASKTVNKTHVLHFKIYIKIVINDKIYCNVTYTHTSTFDLNN